MIVKLKANNEEICFTHGFQYLVIGIHKLPEVDPEYNSDTLIRVIDDTGGRPGYLDANKFEIIKKHPEDWVEENLEGEIFISPPDFNLPGFWEDFFNDEIHAIATYKRVVQDLCKELEFSFEQGPRPQHARFMSL